MPSLDVERMRQDMERLLDRLTGVTADAGGAGLFPPVNVSQDADHYYLRALVPGVDPGQLEVSAVHRTVTVAGARRPTEEAGASYHRRERPDGAFSRSVTLPGEFDASRVEARCVDGVLTLTLPKPEAAKPRRVPVRTA
jgi:HSP20 family protein